MVRQYVGARYVPKFADPIAWASGTSYEAMTIVTYNNSSYTSKMPVPATVGNPADNPDYWALTGNYNAQVEQYRQETETVSNNLTTEITNLKNADTTLQGQITTEITTRKNADTTLQGQITTEITNRKNADATLQNNINAEASARQSADNTLQGNINSEAVTRASADSNLQSQINQIVAPSGEAPSAAEVQNARIGADGVTYSTLGDAIRTNDSYRISSEQILGYNGSVLASADDAKENSIYRITTSELQYLPTNLPEIIPDSWLITLKTGVKNATAIYFWNQYLCDKNLNVYYHRSKIVIDGAGSYGAWEKVENVNTLKKALGTMVVYPSENLIDYNQITKGKYVDYSNGASGNLASFAYAVIPVTAGQTYKLIDADTTNVHIAFFSQYYTGLITNYISGILGNTFTAPTGAKYATVSFPITAIDKVWCNTSDSYIKPEILESAIPKSVIPHAGIRVEKDGSGDYTKLIDALAYGMEHKNTTIYLGAGDFDLIEEHGSQYFEDFVYTPYTNMGPMIGNGTHLICSPKSRILCNYTGDNDEVKKGYSPLNPCATNTFGIGDFVIEGATIIASNVRYCVHDDVGIQVVPYKHEYIRCNMYLDNSNRPDHSHRCIGGGMGVAGTIVVKDCIFDGVGDADNIAVAWHNDNFTQPPMGYIVIEGNYFRGNNTVEIKSISQHTEETHVILRNNSLGSNYVYSKVGPDTDPDNMEVLAWGNEIRSN